MTLKSPELLELELGAGDCKPKGVACVGLFLGGAKSRKKTERINPSGWALWNSGFRVNMLRVGKVGTVVGTTSAGGPKSVLFVTKVGGVTGLVVSVSATAVSGTGVAGTVRSCGGISSSEDSEWSRFEMFRISSARMLRGRFIPRGRRRPSKL